MNSNHPQPDLASHFKHVYTNLAEQYDQLVSREDHAGNILKSLRALAIFSGSNVVEIGAGTGRLTQLFSELAQSVLAFDSSQAMLDVAQKRLTKIARGNWTLQVADNRSLPISDGFADITAAGWTLGHFTEWYPEAWKQELATALGELFRVTKKGGSTLIFETLGTGVEAPLPPTAALSEFYSILEKTYGFSKTVIQTDYEFASQKEMEDLIGMFFGKRMSDTLASRSSITVKEFTGLWVLRKDSRGDE